MVCATTPRCKRSFGGSVSSLCRWTASWAVVASNMVFVALGTVVSAIHRGKLGSASWREVTVPEGRKAAICWGVRKDSNQVRETLLPEPETFSMRTARRLVSSDP